MRSIIVMCVLIAVPSVALSWPWSTDMANQPSIKPQEGVMYTYPERSVPVMGFPTKIHNREEAKSLKSPIPITVETLTRGRQLFRIYCGACHGLDGKASSPVSPKIGAIDLTDDYVQKTLTEGWVFGTASFGSYIMPAYGVPTARDDHRGANDLTVKERWEVVNYVKNALTREPITDMDKVVAEINKEKRQRTASAH
jgi:mono/diheme cytochrome c family protein